jgi:hypothetical protein
MLTASPQRCACAAVVVDLVRPDVDLCGLTVPVDGEDPQVILFLRHRFTELAVVGIRGRLAGEHRPGLALEFGRGLSGQALELQVDVDDVFRGLQLGDGYRHRYVVEEPLESFAL